MSELYGRYHGCMLDLARTPTDSGAWRAKLRELLAELDDARRLLSSSRDQALRDKLTRQLEHEELQFADPDSGRS